MAAPDLNRYSWIKGAPHFDALRQAQIEPAGRAWIGEAPPATASFSQVLSKVDLVDAPWAMTAQIPLNPGLVAIIGARGSGKIALADAIAHGCDATEDPPNSMSFLARASELLAGNSVRPTWGDGTIETRPLDGSYDPDISGYPKAPYLLQQLGTHINVLPGAVVGVPGAWCASVGLKGPLRGWFCGKAPSPGAAIPWRHGVRGRSGGRCCRRGWQA